MLTRFKRRMTAVKQQSQSTAGLSKNVNTDQEKEFTAVTMDHEGQFNHLLPSSLKKSSHKISFRR